MFSFSPILFFHLRFYRSLSNTSLFPFSLLLLYFSFFLSFLCTIFSYLSLSLSSFQLPLLSFLLRHFLRHLAVLSLSNTDYFYSMRLHFLSYGSSLPASLVAQNFPVPCRTFALTANEHVLPPVHWVSSFIIDAILHENSLPLLRSFPCLFYNILFIFKIYTEMDVVIDMI